MNSIQEAVARIVGLDQEFNTLTSTFSEQLAELHEAQEHLISDNALLQRQIEDLDYLNLYDLNQNVIDIIGGRNRKATIDRLRRLRHENPLAKQAVKLTLRFTLGKGIQYTVAPDPKTAGDKPKPVQEAFPPNLQVIPGGNPSPVPPPNFHPRPEVVDDQLTRIMGSWWNDSENQIVFTGQPSMKEWLDDCYTDGERFFACFTDPAPPYVKLADIPLEEIKETIYHPENRRIPIYYKRVFQLKKFSHEAGYTPDGQPQTKYYLDYRVTDRMLVDIDGKINIPAELKADENIRIWHTMPNPLWTKNGQRGLSEIYSSRDWFKVFKEFMEDRAGINAAATSIAYKRKVKGGPSAVASFKGKLGQLPVGYDSPENVTEIRKLTRPSPGAVYDTNQGVDLEWNKADTGAVNAKEDARMLLMAAGAGVGTFVTYFGEGGDANLATAQAMELPMVKSYEDWQEWVNQSLRDITAYVISIATSADEVADQMQRIAFNFPPIITQDVVKYMTAWVQMVTAVAPGNEVVHREAIRGALSVMGVQNIEGLMPLIEEEQKRAAAEREQQRQDMLAKLGGGTGNPNDPASRTGGPPFPGKPPGQALPADTQRIVRGKPPVQRTGTKPA